MYEYEFDWFVKVFKLSIENSNKSKIIEKRLRYLKVNYQYKYDNKKMKLRYYAAYLFTKDYKSLIL